MQSLFNSPRPNPLRYGSPAGNGLSASFLSDNPLAASVYSDDGGMDPWSAAPTPPPVPELPSAFSRIIADTTLPPIYTESLAAVDPTISGETTLNSLNRVLSTSGLPAGTIDRIVNLCSSKPRVSKLEFFVALALAALAQQGEDLSIEKVVSISQQTHTLPSPALDLSQLATSGSDYPAGQVGPFLDTTEVNGRAASLPDNSVPILSPAPAYSENDPWNSSTFRANFPQPAVAQTHDTSNGSSGPRLGGVVLMGGLPPDWWKNQEKIEIAILPEKQGFILNRYTAYIVSSGRGPPVTRRYSEFSFLWDCLLRRYPFRIIPNLPPKRLGGLASPFQMSLHQLLTPELTADTGFLEQRRKGLVRCMNFIVNHPVLAKDGLLSVFLTESSFDGWRKHAANTAGISLEEESASKRIERVEEMGIPNDLEDKIELVKGKLGAMMEQWTRIAALAERLAKRREAAAADLSRLHITLNAVVEVNARCWHQQSEGESCDLSSGVRDGVAATSRRLAAQSDIVDSRARAILTGSVEALKSQRDLYIATRDLFNRHMRLAPDRVEILKKRVEANSHKLEGVKAARKDGWAQEADRITAAMERDHVDIAKLLARRTFIRHCIWHELRVVLHNRENAMVSQALQVFAAEEREFAERFAANWAGLVDDVEDVPFE